MTAGTNFIVFYIENEIDYKYQIPFLKLIGNELPDTLKIYYRKIPGLVSISDFMKIDITDKKVYGSLVKEVKKYRTIPKLLKAMNTNGTVSTLITGYNFKKRGIQAFKNIRVINLGHSISGNTKYNLSVWTEDNNPKSSSIVPRFFKNVKRPDLKLRRKFANKRVDIESYYKLIYTLGKPYDATKADDKTILFLPHWTNPIENVRELIKKVSIPEDHRLLVKLHPASIYETTIFLNRTTKEAPNSLAEDAAKAENERKYREVVADINTIPNVEIFDDDKLELIDAIDQSKYLLFDSYSNTLPESIFRGLYHGINQRIAVLNPGFENRSYTLPDLFGYKYIDEIKTMDDFSPVNRELILSYIDVCRPDFIEFTVNEYKKVLNSLLNEQNEIE